MSEIKDTQIRQKMFPAITQSLGQVVRKYLDEELGKGKYQWLWGGDDPALEDAEGNRAVLRYPNLLLANPEVENNRLVQDLNPVIKDMDRVNLVARAYFPAKPVKLVYELRSMTENPDNDESIVLALARASEEIFCIYPVLEVNPDVATKMNVWWGEGKKYSHDVQSTTRIYEITVSAEVQSRKYRKVRLIDPINPVNYSSYLLGSESKLKILTLMFPTKPDETVVYINEEFRWLPTQGSLEFKDWSEECAIFTGRKLNALHLEEPLKYTHLRGTSLRLGE